RSSRRLSPNFEWRATRDHLARARETALHTPEKIKHRRQAAQVLRRIAHGTKARRGEARRYRSRANRRESMKSNAPSQSHTPHPERRDQSGSLHQATKTPTSRRTPYSPLRRTQYKARDANA